MFYVDSAKCTGCGACVEVCPRGAINLKDDGASINQDLCTGCGSCLDACAAGAIYEVKAPVVAPELAPIRITPRPPVVSRKQASIAATLVGLAPAAFDVLSGLAKRWLSLREEWSNVPGTRLGRGAGRGRRRRGGHR